MKIKILGPGCGGCQALERMVDEALATLGLPAQVVRVTDYEVIASYGVLSTPGLVVDDEVVLCGRVPTASHVRELLQDRAPRRR
ncbi:thioredoxin family protein [Cellulomonas phragmiteti]|uniref:Thioredoxin-like fold domain-containing protein n=1 Tax=Cellulomonas phragmiteti TaxID=478780 RepID=A0ABQ4DPE9_9CELL|nr:thioredoxin family protein [Cellulomonas phragmiteti]GIG41235.1 hypothetical protein Cph01nite_29970 [Cellulomonas phragmiteti]